MSGNVYGFRRDPDSAQVPVVPGHSVRSVVGGAAHPRAYIPDHGISSPSVTTASSGDPGYRAAKTILAVSVLVDITLAIAWWQR